LDEPLMGDAAGYNVSPERLKAHADQVAELAERIRNAAAAANQVGLGGFAGYGPLVGGVVGAVLTVANHKSDQLMNSAADLGGSLSEAIRKTATDYTKIEDDVVELTTTLGKKL
jgi:hypothetical protein